MNPLDIIKQIEGIEEEEIIAISERYKEEKGYISILTVDELEEMIKDDYDVSYLEYIEQQQDKHTHLVVDVMSTEFWFASVQ